MQLHTVTAHVFLIDKLTTLVETELHDRTDKIGSRDDGSSDIRLLDMVDERWIGQSRWVMYLFHTTLLVIYHIGYVRNGGDDIHVELTVQTLLYNLHVEQTEESASETEAQGNRTLRREGKRSIVELQLLQ